MKCSNTTTGGVLLTDWPEDKCRSGENRTHLAAPSAHGHRTRPFTAPKFHSVTATLRQEGLWGQLGVCLATSVPPMPGTHLPLSSCARLAPSAGTAPAGTCARTPLWEQREAEHEQTSNSSPQGFFPHIYSPAWSREWTFGLQTMGAPDGHSLSDFLTSDFLAALSSRAPEGKALM